MEPVHDHISSKLASETFLIFLSKLGLLIADVLFEPDDWRFKFNVFAIFVFHSFTRVDQQHHNRLSSHHVLFDVWVVRCISVLVK